MNIKRFAWACLILSVLLAGCQVQHEETTEGHQFKIRGSGRFVCVDGVKYVIWDRGITVMLDKNSKTIPCE